MYEGNFFNSPDHFNGIFTSFFSKNYFQNFSGWGEECNYVFKTLTRTETSYRRDNPSFIRTLNYDLSPIDRLKVILSLIVLLIFEVFSLLYTMFPNYLNISNEIFAFFHLIQFTHSFEFEWSVSLCWEDQ